MENNILELKIDLNNLSDEDRAKFIELTEKATYKEKPKSMKPRYGDKCVIISRSGLILNDKWFDSEENARCYALGNYFKTKEDAEFALEKQKTLVELRRHAEEHNTCAINWKDSNQKKYYIWYDNVSDTVTYSYNQNIHSLGQIYFSSAEVVSDAIENVGRERIKKYLFGVE